MKMICTIVLAFLLLVTCKEERSDAESESPKNNVPKDSLAKLLLNPNADTNAHRRDNTTSVTDVSITEVDSFSEVEEIIMDTIISIKEVKKEPNM